MKKYGVSSWKPTTLWSNSSLISEIDLGAMSVEERMQSVPLATTYLDKNGVKRCTGKKKLLKSSQILVFFLSVHLILLWLNYLVHDPVILFACDWSFWYPFNLSL